MATNIEMNVKQESDYEVIYPQTICDMVINLLNSDTKELMGLEPTADADDAFRKVYLAQVLDGRALINFTVMGDDGTPCKGVQIESGQFCDANGNKTTPVETDDNGEVSVFVDNISVQASISKYANLSDWSETIAVEFGQQYDKSITLNRYNFKLWENSGSCKFSPEIVRVDVSLCGGGGAGADGYARNQNYDQGCGGGGGYSNVQEDISVTGNLQYDYLVGSAGVAGGGDGGNSSFLSFSANGGQGGDGDQAGGIGNGNGAGPGETNGNGLAGGNGSGYVYISFTNTTQVGGGGGSGVCINGTYNDGGTFYGGAAGSPNGGKGGSAKATPNYGDNWVEDGTSASGYAGGGGGGCGTKTGSHLESSSGGKGGLGVVSIRMYRQQDLS